MAVDLKAEMAKLVARHGEAIAEYMGPDRLLRQVIHHGDMNDFKEFFVRYANSGQRWKNFKIQEYDSILGPRWMARFEPAHLKWICHLLVADDDRLKYTAKIVADRRIAAERRALCFHAVFAACNTTESTLSSGVVILPNLWWYNRWAWSEYLRHVRENSDDAFIKRLDVSIRQTPAYSDSTWAGIRNDSPATLEINRELDNRRISDSLLKCLIKHDAVKCFVHMLKHRADQVFKLRTPREWLLTVCRCAKDELAAAAAVTSPLRRTCGS